VDQAPFATVAVLILAIAALVDEDEPIVDALEKGIAWRDQFTTCRVNEAILAIFDDDGLSLTDLTHCVILRLGDDAAAGSDDAP